MNNSRSSSRVSSKSRKASPSSSNSFWKWGAGAAALGTACAGAALLNHKRAKAAEHDNPPIGSFVTVDGVSLHYLERGEGPAVVLLHGNGTMIEDWMASDIFDELAKTHRVIAFDRPGFGHSDRPRSRVWTPAAQASLVAAALRELKVERATVVGHSFGTLVTVALALDNPSVVSRIVLIGGYYYPSVRGDVLFAAPPAIPLFGDLMRYTISPILAAALMPAINAKLFDPAPVAEGWTDRFPIEMTLRPSQIRAEAAEAAMMIPAASALSSRYEELDLPVTILAGSGDRIVDIADQSERLHAALPRSQFVAVDGAGHMVHHTASQMIVGFIMERAKADDSPPRL